MRCAGIGVLLLGLGACSSNAPAPVSERSPVQAGGTTAAAKPAPAARPAAAPIVASSNGRHAVQRGETLYAIAFANNLDYRDVASWNRLDSADLIRVGQVLRLTPPPGAVEIRPLDDTPLPSARPLAEPPLLREPQAVSLAYSEADWARVSSSVTPPTPASATVAKPPSESVQVPAVPAAAPASAAASGDAAIDDWLWPAEGSLAGRFGAAGGKGIDIVGARNAPVKAVASGKVVYSGSGLRGYGRLLIVKHAGEYLSAYAHNEAILVKEGDSVTAGQPIARMGDSDAERVKLHFEIRRYGKPLDPLDYLPERS
jgi:lipoprotein NlpD